VVAGHAFLQTVDYYSTQTIAEHVPEPATFVMVSTGLLGPAALRRRRHQQ